MPNTLHLGEGGSLSSGRGGGTRQRSSNPSDLFHYKGGIDMKRRLIAPLAALVALDASMFMGSAAEAAWPFYPSGPICAGTPVVTSTAQSCSFDDEFNSTRLKP